MNISALANPQIRTGVLAADKLVVTRAGVQNYYDPVGHGELLHAIQEIAKTFVRVLRGALTQGDEDARVLACISSPVYRETLTIFAANLMAEKYARDGRMAVLPADDAREWRAAFLDEPLEKFKLLSLLERGVVRPPAWRRFMRPLADVVRPELYARRPIELANMERDTITITLCPLSRQRAIESRTRLVFTPLYEWFYPPTADEIRADPLKPVSSALLGDLVSSLEATFQQLGVARTAATIEILEKFLHSASAWARFYLRRIEREPRRLPRRLWKGTSGVIWSRLLADAVRGAGGTVVGHDHAQGANFNENTLMPFTELQGNDTFVTFTAAYADLYRRIGPEFLVEARMPKIEHAESVLKPRPAARPPAGTPRTIVYVAPYLSNGRMSTAPQMTVPMAYDWQARLFTMLQGMNLEVTQKPHPAAPVAQAAAFEQEFGVHTSHERFEDIMHKYDVLLFDYAPQTSFGAALRSDHPMVLIDFGTVRYQPDMRQKLDRRCALVKGWFDKNNRAQVDAAELRAAIHRAVGLCDREFVDEVIGL